MATHLNWQQTLHPFYSWKTNKSCLVFLPHFAPHAYTHFPVFLNIKLVFFWAASVSASNEHHFDKKSSSICITKQKLSIWALRTLVLYENVGNILLNCYSLIVSCRSLHWWKYKTYSLRICLNSFSNTRKRHKFMQHQVDILVIRD